MSCRSQQRAPDGLVVMAHALAHAPDQALLPFRGSTTTIADFHDFVRRAPADCMITFDDGYQSILDAIPLCRNAGFPVVVFITTSFLGDAQLPYELQIIRAFRPGQVIGLPALGRWNPVDAADCATVYEHIRQRLKPLPLKQRNATLARVPPGPPLPGEPSRLYLNRDEVAALAREPGVEIGSHTCNHPLLTAEPPHVIYRELRRSRRELEQITGGPVRSLAYPYGAHNTLVRILARLAGYQRGFGAHPRPARGLLARSMAIPRTDVAALVPSGR